MGIAYRTYKKKGVTYAQIVNNFRDPATGKSRTTSLKSYGNLDKRKEEDPNFEDKIKADLAALQKDQKQVIEAIRDRALSMRNHENSNTTNFSLGIKFQGVPIGFSFLRKSKLEGHVAQADFQPLRLDLLPLALRLQGAELSLQLRIHPAQDLWRQGGLHLRSEHDVEAVPLSGHEVTVGAPGFRQGVGLLRLHPDRPQDAHRRQQTRI